MRKRRVKSVGQMLIDVESSRWKHDLMSYSMYRKWADEGSSWAAAACERILARYPASLRKHFV